MFLDSLDRRLSGAIHASSLGALDYLILLPGVLHGSFVQQLVVVAIGYLLGSRMGTAAALGCIFTVIVTTVLKSSFARPRPRLSDIGPRKICLRSLLKNHAFPSGDSAQVCISV